MTGVSHIGIGASQVDVEQLTGGSKMPAPPMSTSPLSVRSPLDPFASLRHTNVRRLAKLLLGNRDQVLQLGPVADITLLEHYIVEAGQQLLRLHRHSQVAIDDFGA